MKRRRIRRWTWLHRLTAAAFVGLILLGAFGGEEWFSGSTTSTHIVGTLPLADPLAALEVMLASRSLPRTLVLGTGILVAVAILLGPIFCGWVCPLGLVCDLNQDVNRFLRRRLRLRLPEWRLPPETRYLMLGLAAGLSLAGGLPVFQTVSPINLIAWVLAFRITPLLFAAVGLLLLAEHFAPRLWCRSLCPLGALYAALGRFGRLKVWINPQLAGKTPCRQCTMNCPWGIRVMEDYSLAGKPAVLHPDCTRCGTCVDSCPRGVLRLGLRPFGGRSEDSARPRQPDRTTHPLPVCEHCPAPASSGVAGVSRQPT